MTEITMATSGWIWQAPSWPSSSEGERDKKAVTQSARYFSFILDYSEI